LNLQEALVADEPEGARGAFKGLFDLWQQMAGPFTDLRSLEDLSTWGSRTALDALVETAKSGLVGRRVVVGKGGSRVVFTLSSLDARLDPVASAAGQAEDVRLAAVDVEWRGHRFTDVEAVLGNVHTRLGSRPSLVSAPIDLSLSATGEHVTTLLGGWTSKLVLTTAEQGRMRVRLARHPAWGWVEVQASVVGGALEIRPIGLGRSRRLWQFKRRRPTIRRTVPLPVKARLVGLDVESNRVTVRVRIDEWRAEYLEVLGMASKPR